MHFLTNIFYYTDIQMINFRDKLKYVLALRKISAEELAQQIGMTRQNLNYIYKRGSIDTKWLERMSEILQVPMIYWFEEEDLKATDKNIMIGNNLVNGNHNNIQSNLNDCKNELEQANKKIKSLEEALEIKTMMINDLKEMLKNSKK